MFSRMHLVARTRTKSIKNAIDIFFSNFACISIFRMKVGLFPSSYSGSDRSSKDPPFVDICRDGITGFRKLHKIGFGTYGSIYLAIHRSTSDLFALKKFKFPEDKSEYGLPRSAVREIRILKELTSHRNIVECYGVLVSSATRNNGSIYMVLGFAEHDLVGLLELWKRKLTIPEVKSIILQVLNAVDFCHMKGIVHRDLKCANLLIQKDGTVKLADFGLAREYAQDPRFADPNTKEPFHMTNKVITLWYRPPELLLGSTEYGPEIDMWSVGAILCELILQRPIFSAEKEMGVFGAIVDELGSPISTKADAAFFKTLPLWKDVLSALPSISSPSASPCRTETSLTHTCSRNSWDLVSQMLSYVPSDRISAAAAEEHEFFSEIPLPCLPSEIRLPHNEFCHGMGMKQKRDRSDREDALLASGKKSKQ